VFYWLLAMAVLLLVGSIAGKLFAGADRNWTWSLPLPARAAHSPTAVMTSWGPAQLQVLDARTTLRLPIGILPWWLFALLWTYVATAAALVLLALHHLRRILQRVRDGAPFDEANARRLRWLGICLLVVSLNGVAERAIALAMRVELPAMTSQRPLTLPVDGSLVFVALLLVVLARVFRRGSDLEQDQSLVV
jgi:hypothetical protein